MPGRSSRSSRGNPTALYKEGLTEYFLVAPMGADQYGEVLLVRQRQAGNLGGYNLLRRLLPVCGEEESNRFREEARVLSLFDHPGIATARLLVGTEANPVLIMPYSETRRLDEVHEAALREGKRLSPLFCCRVAAEVAEALHYAHTFVGASGEPLQLIHRDLTPHAILVGVNGQVKLTDFGKSWSRLAGRFSTEGGPFQGSLAYAAPEHANFETLDARADQFSLAVVLLELLTGRHLFDGQERFRAELRERTLRVRAAYSRRLAAPAPLPEMTAKQTEALIRRIHALTSEQVAEATRDAPEELRPVLRKALSPRRDDRFASCAEMATALREYLWRHSPRYGAQELAAEMLSLLPRPGPGVPAEPPTP